MNISSRKLPKRILHIVSRMDRAGAEMVIMNLYREINKKEYQFDFIYFTTDDCYFDQEIRSLGGKIIRLKQGNPVRRAYHLYKALRKGNWSIVHSHTLYNSGINLLMAKLAGVPCRIAHSHNTSCRNEISTIGRSYQAFMRWLLAWTPTNYVACGEAAAIYLFPGKEHVNIIPNAIDMCRFFGANKNITREDLAIPDGKLIILQVGRLMSVKNHSWSLNIAVALQQANIDFQMLFAGDGPNYETILDKIKLLSLQESVRLLGMREDIPELMAASDVMLMPSLYEGFPVVLVESQAAGLPAVISNTISAEVDLGLGLVHFLGLDRSPQVWVDKIINTKEKSKVECSMRKKTLEIHGFSSKSGVDRLMELYK
ncbi:glycosyltransferase family 1 protein [Halomonas alimentaria]|uniref:glycosyltransferase family 1 protein n=1 Tax=Halomonas alimentaria TaxID=147248 RepID=UPI0024907CFB|nr:glycosyltransferase family 1 protein [Halomonas alimentaria]